MRKRVLTALAVLVAILAPAGAAYAQCGPTLTTGEALARAEVAFIGKVIDRSNRDRTAVMEVQEIWKGRRLPSIVTVNGGPADSSQQTSIDRTFLLGQYYLVMPANGRSPFNDSLCSGTQLWSTPTGEIPSHLQGAVGNLSPIPILSENAPSDGDGGLSGSLGNIGVAAIVLASALILIYGFRRLSSGGTRSRRQALDHRRTSRAASTPEAAFRGRRRRIPQFSMPSLFESKRGSRLDRVRRAKRRGRKSPGENEREQLQRAVKLTATRPPSRRNHYTSGRRPAPGRGSGSRRATSREGKRK